jgi:hypothetical protein
MQSREQLQQKLAAQDRKKRSMMVAGKGCAVRFARSSTCQK